VACVIDSVSLFADSIDSLKDTSINVLVLLAISCTLRASVFISKLLAGIVLVPGFATLFSAWEKLSHLQAPDPLYLSLTGAAALVVNLV
jgi:Co/Zn/Cd efflux system component